MLAKVINIDQIANVNLSLSRGDLTQPANAISLANDAIIYSINSSNILVTGTGPAIALNLLSGGAPDVDLISNSEISVNSPDSNSRVMALASGSLINSLEFSKLISVNFGKAVEVVGKLNNVFFSVIHAAKGEAIYVQGDQNTYLGAVDFSEISTYATSYPAVYLVGGASTPVSPVVGQFSETKIITRENGSHGIVISGPLVVNNLWDVSFIRSDRSSAQGVPDSFSLVLEDNTNGYGAVTNMLRVRSCTESQGGVNPGFWKTLNHPSFGDLSIVNWNSGFGYHLADVSAGDAGQGMGAYANFDFLLQRGSSFDGTSWSYQSCDWSLQ